MAQSREEPLWSRVGSAQPEAPEEGEVPPARRRTAAPAPAPRPASLDESWADLRASGLACDRW